MDRHFPVNQEPERRRGFWRDNSLTLALFTLFVFSLLGQSFAGLSLYNHTQAAHGLQPIHYAAYIHSGDFLEGVFENWQAAILQLASLILFGVFLTQRGAAHSCKPGERAPHKHLSRPKQIRRWLFAHSLSIALLLLFAAFFTLHLFAGSAADRGQRILQHQPPLTTAAFAVSSQFWFSTFQTWQAEYFAIALYVVLTIFLRQDNSPESKPVNASDKETGESAA